MSVDMGESETIKFITGMKLTKWLNPIALQEQLALVYAKSEIGPPLNAHEFINYALKFDPNNPYISIKDEIIGMLDERDDVVNNEPIEEVGIVHIGDVVVDRIGFKDTQITL